MSPSPTRVDRDALERYCEELPECRTFLENFFLTCEQFPYEANLQNYRMDLRLYADRPYIRGNQRRLEHAFNEIARRVEWKPSGLFGEVHGYHVLSLNDHVLVASAAGTKYYDVEGLGCFIEGREEHVRVGWGQLPDFEVIYLFDDRDGYGYAMNLDAPELSEWGYAPVGRREG